MRKISLAWLVAIVLIALRNAQTTSCSGNNSDYEQAAAKPRLTVLPAQFSDWHLPILMQGKCKQHAFLGSVPVLPPVTFFGHNLTTGEPYPPDELNTEFVFGARNVTLDLSKSIKYGPIRVCSIEPSCAYFPYNIKQLLQTPFNPNRRTIIVIPGFHSPKECSWQLQLAEIWLELDDVNVIHVSWTGGNNDMIYTGSAANTRLLARQITVLLHYLAQLHGTNLKDQKFTEKIYIIGHSLGAHAAGFVGQDLNGQIGRITGLDPAGPLFKTTINYRLDRTDAKFVDVIHTDIKTTGFGTPIDSGHIDLYANDARNQPGCSSDAIGCSHKAATAFYYLFLKHAKDSARANSNRTDTREYKANRLLAFRADNLADLATGKSLYRYCPASTIVAGDLSKPDLNKCSIPIDYTANPIKYKKELAEEHNVMVDSDDDHNRSPPIHRYIFRTYANQPNQSYHYLVRIVVLKEGSGLLAHRQGCAINLDIDMIEESLSAIAHGPYKLLLNGDRFEVLIPFIVVKSDINSYIFELEYEDYFAGHANQDQELKKSLLHILPKKIILSNMKQTSNKTGISAWFETVADAITFKKKPNCDLFAESVSIEIMKQSRRHFVAYYDYSATKPENVSLWKVPTNSVAPLRLREHRPILLGNKTASFHLAQLIVGPPSYTNDNETRLGATVVKENRVQL